MQGRRLAASEIVPGCRVRVVPGRQFPAFQSDDVGVVARVDLEARTCDVIFQGHGPDPQPIAVALRHLSLDGDGARGWADGGARAFDVSSPAALRSRSPGTPRAMHRSASRSGAADAPQYDHLGASRGASSGGRLVASRVAAIEGAYQVDETLEREFQDAGFDQEQQWRRRRAAIREGEQRLEEAEQRAAGLQEFLRGIGCAAERVAGILEGQERRAASLEEVVGASRVGLSRLSEILEGQERRTSELGQAISEASDTVARLGSDVDAQARRLSDVERRLASAAARSGAEGASQAAPGRQDNEPIWQALRELQELVVHESERRAAGLREVLGVLGQSLDQLRDEQARHLSDADSRLKSEGQKVRQQLEEQRAKREDQERSLFRRLDALSSALAEEREARADAAAGLEQQIRGLQREAAAPPPATAIAAVDGGGGTPRSAGDSPGLQGATAAAPEAPSAYAGSAAHRLEALEARFERSGLSDSVDASRRSVGRPGSACGSTRGGGSVAEGRGGPPSATEDTLGRLRSQLEGLRSELAVAASSPGDDYAAHSARSCPAIVGPPATGPRRWRAAAESPLGSAGDTGEPPAFGDFTAWSSCSVQAPQFAQEQMHVHAGGAAVEAQSRVAEAFRAAAAATPPRPPYDPQPPAPAFGGGTPRGLTIRTGPARVF